MSDRFGLDDLDEINLTPNTAISRKRPRPADDTSDIHDDHSPFTSTNVIQGVKRLGQNKKLRTDQIVELENFLNDTALGREGRAYVLNLELSNKLDKIITTQAAWQPSQALKKNVQSYVAAACLSIHIVSYRGTEMTTRVVLDKLYALGIDLPSSIKQNPAAEESLRKLIEYEFTQKRSAMKKHIRSSMSEKDTEGVEWVWKDDTKCTNIYQLTKSLVKGTRCSVNAELCARVAIMRRAYYVNQTADESKNKDYWIDVDELLEGIRKKGEFDKEKIADLVARQLMKDRTKYGVDNYTITNEDESDVQAEMNSLIEARNLAGESNENGQEHVEELQATDGPGIASNDGEGRGSHDITPN